MSQDEQPPVSRSDGSHEVEAVLAAYLAHLEEGSPPEDFLALHPESEPALRELRAFIDSIALDLPPPEAGADVARRRMRTTLRWRRLQQFLRVPAQRPRLWVVAASLGIGLSFGAAFAQEPYRVFQPITAVVHRLPPLPASPPEQAARSQSQPAHAPSATQEAPTASAPTPTPTPQRRPEPTADPFVLPALANTNGRENSARTAGMDARAGREQADDLHDALEAGLQTPDHESPAAGQLDSDLSGTPSATPTPSSTHTPQPTSTPARPSTREATATPTPANSPGTPGPTPSASPTPTATQTADPTATETPTPSPTPGEGVAPCDEGTPQPTPTGTRTPTPTSAPDETPQPCATEPAEPTATATPAGPDVASEPAEDTAEGE